MNFLLPGRLGRGSRKQPACRSMISEDQLDLVIFLRDPLAAQPHEPDVTALIRLSDVYEIPLATNIGTAEVLLRGLEAGFLDFRRIVHEIDKRPLSF